MMLKAKKSQVVDVVIPMVPIKMCYLTALAPQISI
jgi:hypothetical protein